MERRMIKLRIGLWAALFAVVPLQQAASWGAGGHSVVAEIAQRRLAPDVARKIRALLGGDISLASVAGWADQVVLLRPNTFNWHFVNIPYDATGYVPQRDCKETPKGDCVVNAVERSRATLADRSAPRGKRVEALMLLVHFAGDIHQPLHCVDRNDAGGNNLAVTFFDKPMSLHAVWDYGIIDKRSFDWGEYVRQLEQGWFPGKDLKKLQRGTPAEWAWEAHMAAVEVAYVLPEDLKLGDAYYQRSLPTVDRQLALAGLRLARLLNEAFGRRGYLAPTEARRPH
jgi:hypothetical protein